MLPKVQIGSHLFTFVQVYVNTGSPSSTILEECIAPLVDGLFHGYNAMVLAYGQTGFGKTYTNEREMFQEGACFLDWSLHLLLDFGIAWKILLINSFG